MTKHWHERMLCCLNCHCIVKCEFFRFFFVLHFFVFNRFLFFRFRSQSFSIFPFSFSFSFYYFFVLVLVFINEFIIFSFLTIFVFVFVNENHTEVEFVLCGFSDVAFYLVENWSPSMLGARPALEQWSAGKLELGRNVCLADLWEISLLHWYVKFCCHFIWKFAPVSLMSSQPQWNCIFLQPKVISHKVQQHNLHTHYSSNMTTYFAICCYTSALLIRC
jgi:hypothetical protein